jgi:hypothetical protein
VLSNRATSPPTAPPAARQLLDRVDSHSLPPSFFAPTLSTLFPTPLFCSAAWRRTTARTRPRRWNGRGGRKSGRTGRRASGGRKWLERRRRWRRRRCRSRYEEEEKERPTEKKMRTRQLCLFAGLVVRSAWWKTTQTEGRTHRATTQRSVISALVHPLHALSTRVRRCIRLPCTSRPLLLPPHHPPSGRRLHKGGLRGRDGDAGAGNGTHPAGFRHRGGCGDRH